MRLADALATLTGAPATAVATGQVTALDGPRVVCTVAGAPLTLPRLASYTAPAAGDVVIVLCGPGSWVVLGAVAT